MNLGNGSRDVSKFHDTRGAGIYIIYIYMSLSKLAECHNVSVLQIANNINIKNSNINNPVMSQKYGSHQCCFRPSFENTHFFSRANSFSKPTGKAHIADDHIESSGFGFQEIPMVDPSHTKHPTLLEDTKPNRDKIGISIPKIGYKNTYT